MGEQPLVPAPDAAMSCSISAASVTPSPEPPYSSGMIAPSQPAWAKALTNSHGYSALPSFSSQYSGGKERARLETSLRISSCCSVSAKSMAPASLEVCPILLRASGYDRARSGRWAMTFVQRMVGAAKFSSSAYEDIEADRGATGQALAVVVLSSLAAGIGAGAGLRGLVFGAVASLVGWLVWAVLIYLIGARSASACSAGSCSSSPSSCCRGWCAAHDRPGALCATERLHGRVALAPVLRRVLRGADPHPHRLLVDQDLRGPRDVRHRGVAARRARPDAQRSPRPLYRG